MESTEIQVKNFIARCEELTKSQFILAPTKITELLRTVAASPDILNLFKEASKSFDYFKAQEKYFHPVPGEDNKAELTLPEDRNERLAFLFCLLTDIDSGKLNLGLFLQIFFEDGDGFSPSFSRFCKALIAPLERDVAEALFVDIVISFALPRRDRSLVKAEAIALCEAEKREIALSIKEKADLSAGNAILDEYLSALKEDRTATAEALILGYHYFTLSLDADRKNVMRLLKLSEEL